MINQLCPQPAKIVTRNSAYYTRPPKSCQAKSDEEFTKLLSLLQNYRAQGPARLQSGGAAVREQVYTALRARTALVCQRVAHHFSEADVQDMVQEALARFCKQDLKGTGIFNAAIPLTALLLNSNIKGNAVQRYSDLIKRKSPKIVQCSYHDKREVDDDDGNIYALEYYAASQKHREAETRRAVREGITKVIRRGGSTAIAAAALEIAMRTGRFNSSELAREHGVSQPTAWREIKGLKRRLREELEHDSFGFTPLK